MSFSQVISGMIAKNCLGWKGRFPAPCGSHAAHLFHESLAILNHEFSTLAAHVGAETTLTLIKEIFPEAAIIAQRIAENLDFITLSGDGHGFHVGEEHWSLCG